MKTIKLPLNDDGSVDTVAVLGHETHQDVIDLIKAIEAHTIERCALLCESDSHRGSCHPFTVEMIRNLASEIGDSDE